MDNVVFKRKWRWTIEGNLPGGRLEPIFVKVAARPQLNIEEIEVKVGNTTSWTPGKAEWEVLTVSLWDVAPDDKKIWPVLGSSYVETTDGKYPNSDKLSTFKLVLYDGYGVVMEEWELSEAYVSKFEFFDESPECTSVEVIIRYKKVEYKSMHKSWPSNPPSTTGMGLGSLGGSKVKCPKCEHEFSTPGCNIY
jgi:hypothetical protein